MIFFGEGLAEALPGRGAVRIVNGAGRTTALREGFVTPIGLARHAEELLVWDAFTAVLTRLDADGGVVGEVDLRAAVEGLQLLGTALGAFGNAVSIALRPPSHWDIPHEPTRVRAEALVVFAEGADGTPLRTLSLPGEEWWATRTSHSFSNVSVIFGRNVMVAGAHGGVWVADTDSLVFRMYDGSGLVREVSLGHEPVHARPEWIEQVADSIRHWNDTSSNRRHADLRQPLFAAGLPARSTLPAFSDLLGGADGRLWIREATSPDRESALWVGVDESFRPELRIEVPIGMEVLDIDHGRVLTRSPDRPQVVQVHQLGEGS